MNTANNIEIGQNRPSKIETFSAFIIRIGISV